MKKYKIKLTCGAVETLDRFLGHLIMDGVPGTDEDRMLLAVLSEIRGQFYKKLGTPQKEYRLSFSPAQAIALRVVYLNYMDVPATSYLGNYMRLISDEVAKLYC